MAFKDSPFPVPLSYSTIHDSPFLVLKIAPSFVIQDYNLDIETVSCHLLQRMSNIRIETLKRWANFFKL